jgi:carboxymethylenebutenolidase
MCFDDGALVPEPPGELGPAHGDQLVLTSADGTGFHASVALPEDPGRTRDVSVLIYPDIRGLHAFYAQLAVEFAGLGFPALAIDYFGRTAGLSERNDAFEHQPHVQQLSYPSLLADTQAGLAELEGRVPGNGVVSVGFCLGGTLSLMAGAHPALGLAGVVGFYAGMKRDFGEGTALDQAGAITVPVLGLFGGADKGIPVEQVESLDQRLDPTGVDHEIVIYPGAPHSFFDRRSVDHADATADSWRRIVAFLEARSASPQKR